MLKYKEIESRLIEDEKDKYVQISLRDEQLEEFKFNMINGNSSIGLIEVTKSKFNTDVNIKYCVTGYDSLDEYVIKNQMNKEKLVKVFEGIANVLDKSKQALLKVENFALEKENIFINKETSEVRLINIPLKDNYCLNINESYINMVKDLVSYILNKSSIETSSAGFLIEVKNKVEENGLSISEFRSFIKKESKVTKEPTNIGNRDNKGTTSTAKRIDNGVKSIPTPPQTIIRPIVEEKQKTIKVEEKGQASNVKVIEKKQYKTGRIIGAIIIQPIFIGILLLLLVVLNGLTTVQMIGGGVILLALDGLVLRILLDPSKKETIKIEVPERKSSINQANKNNEVAKKSEVATKKLNNIKQDNLKKENKQPIPTKTIQEKPIVEDQIDPATDVEDDIDPATNVEDDTNLVRYAYLEIDNGTKVGSENITSDNFIIGRSENLREWLKDNTNVSRQHAQIIKVDEQYSIKDLSKNGTKLNGIRIGQGNVKELNDGDSIEISDIILTFRA